MVDQPDVTTAPGAPASSGEHTQRPAFNPLRAALDLASSVRLGITMLGLLFVYAAIGSAGHYPVIRDGQLTWSHQMIRQLRPFEMTEFEWFHTWAFVGLCAAICINLTVVTVRKIPFTVPKLGVWTIHAGIITMTIGSVVYFATKVEGDTPVVRRQITINIDEAHTASLPALIGAERSVAASDGEWAFRIADINPEYVLLSGPNRGTTDFAVSVEVTRPDGVTFIRQLLDLHPDLTEDAVRLDNPAPGTPPLQRFRNLETFNGQPTNGEPLLDTTLALALDVLPQQHFWLKDTWALAVRDVSSPDSPWSHRPIRGLPRYNDYIDAPGAVFPPPHAERFPIDPLDITVKPKPDDALPELRTRVTGYLRYAVMSERWREGGITNPFNPVVQIIARTSAGESRRADLVALDARSDNAFQGLVGVEWVDNPDDLAAAQRSLEGAVLDFRIPDQAERLIVALNEDDIANTDDAPFTPIRNTGFAYRVRQIIDRLDLPGTEQRVSMAEVEITTPDDTTIRRWVFHDPRLTRDVDDDTNPTGLDQRIRTRFVPRAEDTLIIAGPGIGVRILTTAPDGTVIDREVSPRQFIPIAEGVELAVTDVLARAIRDARPAVVPRNQRQADADAAHSFAMVNVELALDDGTPLAERWVLFHQYSFDDSQLYRGNIGIFRPQTVELPDGRTVELIFTRQRRELPAPVALDQFHLRSHVGGFTGDALSIRDWVSDLRFASPDAPDDFAKATDVRVNNPREVNGLWYFQAFWDAPRNDPSTGTSSPGMAFTGLGVGNRNGVITALVGATLSVLGMIYAFYVKPIILERRKRRVHAELQSTPANTTQEHATA